MTEGPKKKIPENPKLERRLWDRFLSFLRRKRELRIEDILRAAKKGGLDQLLNSYYTVYTDPSWQDKLQLCKDLKEADLLQAKFKNDSDGTIPIFVDGKVRITIAGREYLSQPSRVSHGGG